MATVHLRGCIDGTLGRFLVLATTGALLLSLSALVGGGSARPARAESDDDQASPLKPRDVPPEGVALQLLFFDPQGAGGQHCRLSVRGLDEDRDAPPPGPCSMEITDSLTVRLEDFDPHQAVVVRIRRPDGQVDETVREPSYYGPDWFSAPGEPLGRYTFTARQGALQRSGTFMVRPATKPSVALGTARELPTGRPTNVIPGEPIYVYLAGYRAYARVPMYVYQRIGFQFDPVGGAPQGQYRFTSFLGTVTMDTRGEYAFWMPTASDDRGSFQVVTDPLPFSPVIGRFNVGMSAP